MGGGRQQLLKENLTLDIKKKKHWKITIMFLASIPLAALGQDDWEKIHKQAVVKSQNEIQWVSNLKFFLKPLCIQAQVFYKGACIL